MTPGDRRPGGRAGDWSARRSRSSRWSAAPARSRRARRTRPPSGRPRRGCAGRSPRPARPAAAPGRASMRAGEQVVRVRVLVRRDLQRRCPGAAAPPVIRSSSARPTSSTGMPRSAARCTASRTRSSLSMTCCTYSAVVGICRAQRLDHRVAADQQLRATRRAARAGLRAAVFAAPRPGALLGWPLRCSAGGVGPRPSRPRRRWPPVPTDRALLVAGRRLGALRPGSPVCALRGLPGDQCASGARRSRPRVGSALAERPARARRGVLDHDAGCRSWSRIASAVGVVLARPGLLPLLQRDRDQRVDHAR